MMWNTIINALGSTASFREAIGMAASILVCVSLCMKRIKGLRIINMLGSAIFIAYGILLRSPSILVLNGFAVAVNIYYLVQIFSETKETDVSDQ